MAWAFNLRHLENCRHPHTASRDNSDMTTLLRRPLPDSRISPEMPLLHLFSQHPVLAKNQPLRDVHVLSTLHALPNLCSTLAALERLGLEPETTHLFFKAYPYPGKAETLARVAERGYRTAPVESLNAESLAII